MARFRSKSFISPRGYWQGKNQYGSILTSYDSTKLTSGSGNWESYDTHDQPGVDHNLDLIKKNYAGLRLFGVCDIALGFNWCPRSTVMGWRVAGPSSPILPNLPSINWSYYQTKAMANINPNKPVVDLPLFLFELREFPRMLKELGDILRKKISPALLADPDFYRKQFLAYQFGWKPLISDLTILLGIASEIDRRRKLLERAASGRGTKVRRKLGNKSLTEVVSNTFETKFSSATTGCVGYYRFNGTQQVWATARLKVSGNLPSSLLDPTSVVSTLGLYPSAATLWGAMPWSWLIDYFVNVSDFLEANRGFMKYRIYNLNVMAKQSYEGEYIPTFVKPGLYLQKKKVPMFNRYKGRRVMPAVAKLTYRPLETLSYMHAALASCALLGPLRRL